ncbi:serine hydrolase [Bacteroidota bacterium]
MRIRSNRIFNLTFTLLLAVGLLLPIYAFTQENEITIDYKNLSNYFEKARQDWNVPGMAVAIVKDDKIVFSKGFGVRDINEKDKVDEHTIFAIASNTKSFTSAALAMLVDEGKINWDDPVIKHLPYFQLYDPYVTNAMKIRDLLCHRSGLVTFSGDLLWYGTTYDREEVVRRARFLKPKHGFREKFGYSNIMYIAAGEIIEKASGKSWDEFIKERIFDPLKMKNTNTSIDKLKDIVNVAQPHTNYNDKVISIPYLNWDNIGPAGSINSSVYEMSQWIRLQLNKGTLNGNKFFSEASSDEMWKPHTINNISPAAKEIWPSTHFKTYGMGWGQFDYHGRKVVSHSGGYDGMISYTGLVPEENLGFIILTNANSMLFYAIAFKILDTYLSDQETDWSETFIQYDKMDKAQKLMDVEEDKRNRVKNTKPSLPPEAFSGTYSCELYGDAVIEFENDEMSLKLVPAPLFIGDLTHWHYNTFQIVFSNFPSLPPGKVNFTLDAKGNIETMIIDVPNPDFDFTELLFRKVTNNY